MANSYKVVVTGRLLHDDVDSIKQKIVKIFNLPEPQLKALVSGKALIIKKNITASNAMQFKKALTECGLECIAEPMDEASIVQADELEAQGQAQDKALVKPESSSPKSFKMAPVGSRIGPRPNIPNSVIPNVDHLQAGRSDRLSPESQPGPPPPNVDHLQATASDRLSPESQPGPTPPNVDHLNVAPVGDTLGKPVAAPSPKINIDHIAVAKVGETLGEAKQVAELELDLSHLSLKLE